MLDNNTAISPVHDIPTLQEEQEQEQEVYCWPQYKQLYNTNSSN